MIAAAAASVAQLSQGERAENSAGTGADHSNPITASTIGGTQIQCSSLLVGCWWLAPYSPSHSVTVRMPGDATRPTEARQEMRGEVSGGHHAAQLAESARLDLPDALGRHPVLAGELVQRRLVLRHPAALDDVAAAVVESAQGPAQALRGIVGTLGVLHLFGGIGIRGWQIRCRAVELLIVRFRRRIKRQVAGREALLHLRDFARRDSEIARDRRRLLRRQPGEVLLQAPQREEH